MRKKQIKRRMATATSLLYKKMCNQCGCVRPQWGDDDGHDPIIVAASSAAVSGEGTVDEETMLAAIPSSLLASSADVSGEGTVDDETMMAGMDRCGSSRRKMHLVANGDGNFW